MVKIVYAFFYAISLLPFRLLYCIADFEYFMMYYVIKYRRGIVRKNLTSSFPEKSEEEIIDIEKKFYRWFSDYFFEAVKLLSISDKGLRQRFQVINSEEVEQCFQEGQNVAAILGITATGSGSHVWASNCPSHARWVSSIILCATKPSTNSSSASVLTRRMAWWCPRKTSSATWWITSARAS